MAEQPAGQRLAIGISEPLRRRLELRQIALRRRCRSHFAEQLAPAGRKAARSIQQDMINSPVPVGILRQVERMPVKSGTAAFVRIELQRHVPEAPFGDAENRRLEALPDWKRQGPGEVLDLAALDMPVSVIGNVGRHLEAISRFIGHHNQAPEPFIWKAYPKAVIAAAKRGHQTLQAIHDLLG